jgi:dynein heavy chain 2
MCQKALNSYLEEKRSIFSRFYFIGDDDLLEILGQAKNPAIIQSHLKKLFAGIFKVELIDNNTKIKSMISSAGEVVPLINAIQISEDVENWLGVLEVEMRKTLDNLLKKNLGAGGLDIVNLPSQICCLVEMIWFSQNTANAIKKNALASYKKDLMEKLNQYTTHDNKGDVLLFSKLKALILDIIHNIDVVDQLLRDNVIMQS